MTISNSLQVNKTLRHSEYYDFQDVQDQLYAASRAGKTFSTLKDIILSEQNIVLAYRNIKSNAGSMTPGTDGLTIKDIGRLPPVKMVNRVRNIVKSYEPRAVRRKNIPKPNGKLRPLGIPCIWDRLIQQCVLQVLEPICEAKFSENSHGFRPNRSCETAVAQVYNRIQRQGLYYVVDMDIKGFFDNVNHTKLIRQMWTLGIRDKWVLYIVKRMLKAPILMPDGTQIIPEKGTPQGGILSPLLSNIVLNELDQWIDSQWQENPVTRKYSIGHSANGLPCFSSGYRAMRNTALKEVKIVRYADDFRIFCRTKSDATRILVATTMWLQERLSLEIASDKTKIVNLKRKSSEFLGFEISAGRKGSRFVVISHVTPRAEKRMTQQLREQIKKIEHVSNTANENAQIMKYNSMVLGMHNYYRIATHVNVDFGRIGFIVKRVIHNRLRERVKRDSEGHTRNDVFTQKYIKSQELRYIHGTPLLPISFVQTRRPMNKKRRVNKFTPEGRAEIHKCLGLNLHILRYLMEHPVAGRSVEYNDNRLSLYCGQYGRCAVTGMELQIGDIHCHHRIPVRSGGTDEYKNLVLVTETVHRLIHVTDQGTIARYLAGMNLNQNQKKKLNSLRQMVGNDVI